jgi:hypothetical protein
MQEVALDIFIFVIPSIDFEFLTLNRFYMLVDYTFSFWKSVQRHIKLSQSSRRPLKRTSVYFC